MSLYIEPCLERENKRLRRIMTDWKRDACEILLKLYRDHPILYDMKHPKYYNKRERQNALNNIIDMLEEYRPGTTTSDILKKIQTMRTQFGQEHVKARRRISRGDVHYQPTIWWYKHLAFLQDHIKRRASVDVKEELEQTTVTVTQASEDDYENYPEEYEVENDDQDVLYEIQTTSPSGKDSKTDTFVLKKAVSGTASTPVTLNGANQITYEIIGSNQLVQKRKTEPVTPVVDPKTYEIVGSSQLAQKRKFETITPVAVPKTPRLEETYDDEEEEDDEEQEQSTSSPIPVEITPAGSGSLSVTPSASKKDASGIAAAETSEITVDADRCRSLGNFVASQIASLKDDYLFYSTQMDVLNIINKAQLKQLQLDKEERNKK